MKDIAPQLRAWQAAGKRFALATLIRVERSAPKPPGAVMAVCEDGTVAGSVSGGCVESALHDEAQTILETGQPKQVSFGISDDEGFQVGLACGGTLHLFVDRPELPAGLLEAIESGRPAALATVVSGENAGARLLVPGEQAPFAAAELSAAVVRDAEDMLGRAQSGLRSYPEGDVFIQSFSPAAQMYVFGAADFSAALARIGKFLGYRVTVCDPRPVFATKERFPDADEVVAAWPDACLTQAEVGPSTVVCVLTHDPKFDIPALKYVLTTDAGYIGAMGAKRTNEGRIEKLRAEGCSDEQIARIHMPIGLDIGGKSPEETAVSIAAEIVAWRNGRDKRASASA